MSVVQPSAQLARLFGEDPFFSTSNETGEAWALEVANTTEDAVSSVSMSRILLQTLYP